VANQKVIAIVRLTSQGDFEQLKQCDLPMGEQIMVVPTAKGVVIVIGDLNDEDLSRLEDLLERFD